MSKPEEPIIVSLNDSLLIDVRTQVVRAERSGQATLLTLLDGTTHRVFDPQGKLWEAFKTVAIF